MIAEICKWGRRLPADALVARERLLSQGAGALSDAEPLAVLKRGRRDDFGTAPEAPVAEFLTQFRDWCFSGEPAQLAYQIPTLPLAS